MMSQLPPDKEPELEKNLGFDPSKEFDSAATSKATSKKFHWLRKPKTIALLLALLLVFGVIGYGMLARRKPKTDAIASLTVPVEFQNRTIRIQASGTVRPIQSVNLSPKNAGRIEELRVEQGDRVQQGDIIAIMDSQDIDARLVQAEARLNQTQARLAELRAGNRREDIAQAEARLNQAQARLATVKAGSRFEEIAGAGARVVEAQARVDLTEVRVKRNQQLASEGAISQDALDEVVTENRRAKASLQEAERRLEQLKQSRREEVEQAEAEVEEAQQALALQENGPRPEEIARAEAEVREAQQALALQENGPRPEVIARAEAEVREAQQALALQENGSRPEVITQAEAEMKEALGQLREVEVQLEDTIVRAPFSGQITQRYATEGAFVAPTTSASSAGQATSTSIVALARGLEVLGKIPEADISQIKPGQLVEIVADAYPDQMFAGRVHLIAPEAIKEQDVTLFEVRVDIDSGLELLRSGMNVDVTFLGDELKNALVVPTVAIVTNKGETGVLVPNQDNQAEFRPVTIGPTIGNDIQILSGLNSGDRVFVGLPEGQKLEDILQNEK